MHCEYCNYTLPDISIAKQHLLTIAHIRNKRSYDLSRNLFTERRRQAAIHPKSFEDLALQLNMHTYEDVRALDDQGFFKIKDSSTSAISRELVTLLNRSVEDYNFAQLPEELRAPLATSLKRQKEESERNNTN